MNETDKMNARKLTDASDSLLKKLRSNPPVTCKECGVEWNKLYRNGICIDCDSVEREGAAAVAAQDRKKSTGFNKALDDVGIMNDYPPGRKDIDG